MELPIHRFSDGAKEGVLVRAEERLGLRKEEKREMTTTRQSSAGSNVAALRRFVDPGAGS